MYRWINRLIERQKKRNGILPPSLPSLATGWFGNQLFGRVPRTINPSSVRHPWVYGRPCTPLAPSLCLSVYLSIYLSIYLFFYPSLYQSPHVYAYICLWHTIHLINLSKSILSNLPLLNKWSIFYTHCKINICKYLSCMFVFYTYLCMHIYHINIISKFTSPNLTHINLSIDRCYQIRLATFHSSFL